MWQDDVEMAIDAYRTWLEVQIEATLETLSEFPREKHKVFIRGELRGFERALEGFNTIFEAEDE